MSQVAKLKKQAAEFEAKKQFDKAIGVYIKLLEGYDSYPAELDIGLFNRVGDLLIRQGNVADAVDWYERGIDKYSDTGFFNNAMAIGNGAVATRDNQVVIGTATNTYTTPGITSAASRAAQSGPLQVVTSDANGNLATDGGALFNSINNLNSQINQLNQDVKRLDGGVAMAMALGGVYLPEHQRFAVHTDLGFYNGSQAIGVQGIARINQTFTVNGGVAADLSGNGGVGGRIGFSAGW